MAGPWAGWRQSGAHRPSAPRCSISIIFLFPPLSYATAFKTTLWGAQSSILGAVFDFTLGQSEAEGKGNSGTVY